MITKDFLENFVNITYFFWNELINHQNYQPEVSSNHHFYWLPFSSKSFVHIYFDRAWMSTFFHCKQFSLFRTIEYKSCSKRSLTWFSDIIQTKHHILWRNSNRCTIRRIQNVMWSKQHLSFQNSFITKRQVNSHLVTIKVALNAVQANGCNCSTFQSFFGWNAWIPKRCKVGARFNNTGCPFHYVFQNIPNHRIFTVNNFLQILRF